MAWVCFSTGRNAKRVVYSSTTTEQVYKAESDASD